MKRIIIISSFLLLFNLVCACHDTKKMKSKSDINLPRKGMLRSEVYEIADYPNSKIVFSKSGVNYEETKCGGITYEIDFLIVTSGLQSPEDKVISVQKK